MRSIRKLVRRAVTAVVVVATAGGLTLAATAPAHADAPSDKARFLNAGLDTATYDRCGRFWPSAGYAETQVSGLSTRLYRATLQFAITAEQKRAMQCVGDWLEVDFHIAGFWVAPQWARYEVWTNLPNALKDSAMLDLPGQSTPGVTRVWTGDLVPGQVYFTTIEFSLYAHGTPRVSMEFVPSGWASDPDEKTFCGVWRPVNGDTMCIFGRARAYLSAGYNNGKSSNFDPGQTVRFEG